MGEKRVFPGAARAMPAVLLLILSAFLLFSGCGQSPQEAIIGKWQLSGADSTIEFWADGTLVSTGPSGEASSGTYEFIGENQVRLLVGSTETVVQVDIRGNQMSLVGSREGGSRASFLTRVHTGQE
ncbi:MAG: DUF4923 family protein [Chloroflexaceae bacterium]|nr:DUF4923 family protein [Chloroflexaceae bacterium]